MRDERYTCAGRRHASSTNFTGPTRAVYSVVIVMSETEDERPSVAQKIITEFLVRDEVKLATILR